MLQDLHASHSFQQFLHTSAGSEMDLLMLEDSVYGKELKSLYIKDNYGKSVVPYLPYWDTLTPYHTCPKI